MAIETHPQPDNWPQRPRLTAEVLRNLYASDMIANNLTSRSGGEEAAQQWLVEMRKWAAWAPAYCKRLDAAYVEHQAIAHDRRVESGELAGYPDDTLGIHYATTDKCEVCAYLLDQHKSNRL